MDQALEDGLLSLNEENALSRYASRFNLGQQDLNENGAQTTLVQAAILREVTEGIIPDRQNVQGNIPFNLMKSEQLVWVIQGVDYLETVTRRERRGSSQGVSIRVAKGLYYSPRQFQSRAVEWEETVKADTGLLNQYQGGMCISEVLRRPKGSTARHITFTPQLGATDSAVERYVHFTLALARIHRWTRMDGVRTVEGG